VEVEVIAKLQVINPFDYFVEEYAENFLSHTTNASARMTAYLNLSEESPIFLKFMEGLKLNQSIPTDFLVSINQAVYKELSYFTYGSRCANTRRNFTYQEWILQRFCMAIDSRFTPLWISSTICICYIVQLSPLNP
jgi:hypothetical protein